jgi:hypothetical protein|tara:strand:- start:596 stop:862 length:267 start_codon:yes stop_codon:yes gene_type:complete
MNEKEHKRRSVNYKAQLKKAIHNGDFEGIVMSIMLLAVKHNDEQDWKAGPRTFMELLQVLAKYRQEFGENGMEEVLKVLQGGKDEDSW